MSRLAQGGATVLPVEMVDKEIEVLVLCHHGVRSAEAIAWLRQGGWTNAYSVRGGISEYTREIDSSIGQY
jgi:rhodanese-related sulfurtransferase